MDFFLHRKNWLVRLAVVMIRLAVVVVTQASHTDLLKTLEGKQKQSLISTLLPQSTSSLKDMTDMTNIDILDSALPRPHLSVNQNLHVTDIENINPVQDLSDVAIGARPKSVSYQHRRRHGNHKLSHQSRGRRHIKRGNSHDKHSGHSRKSCKTKSAFVYHKTAKDIYGNTVTLSPFIHIGKVAIDQYFYETFCDKEACTCAGIDETRYRSSCETTYSFTYARVIKQGELGWSQIMVRSGCGCVIHEKKYPKWTMNIIDSL